MQEAIMMSENDRQLRLSGAPDRTSCDPSEKYHDYEVQQGHPRDNALQDPRNLYARLLSCGVLLYDKPLSNGSSAQSFL